jgi:hypothetical protein
LLPDDHRAATTKRYNTLPETDRGSASCGLIAATARQPIGLGPDNGDTGTALTAMTA